MTRTPVEMHETHRGLRRWANGVRQRWRKMDAKDKAIFVLVLILAISQALNTWTSLGTQRRADTVVSTQQCEGYNDQVENLVDARVLQLFQDITDLIVFNEQPRGEEALKRLSEVVPLETFLEEQVGPLQKRVEAECPDLGRLDPALAELEGLRILYTKPKENP